MFLTLSNTIWGKPGKEYLSWLWPSTAGWAKDKPCGKLSLGQRFLLFFLPQEVFHWHNKSLQKRSFFPDLFTHSLGELQVCTLTTGAQDLRAAWSEACCIKGQSNVLGKQTCHHRWHQKPVPKITFSSSCFNESEILARVWEKWLFEIIPSVSSGELLLPTPQSLMCYSREFSEEAGWPLIHRNMDVSSCL